MSDLWCWSIRQFLLPLACVGQVSSDGVLDSFLKWLGWLSIWSKVLRSESECVCDSLAVSACWCKAPIGRQPLTSAEIITSNLHLQPLPLDNIWPADLSENWNNSSSHRELAGLVKALFPEIKIYKVTQKYKLHTLIFFLFYQLSL